MNIVKSLSIILILLLFDINTYGAQMELTTSDNLTTVLKKQDNNKILIFFTSWCPYCKTAIQQTIDSKAIDKTTFISLDKDYSQIKNFALSMPDDIIIYYMMSQNEIIAFLNRHNIRYSGSIPYISILDKDNVLIADGISLRRLNRYLK